VRKCAGKQVSKREVQMRCLMPHFPTHSLSHLLTFSLSFFFFCLFFFQKGWSQSVKWSAPLIDEKKLPYLKILGQSDDGYYLLRSNSAFTNEKKPKSRKYELQYYTNSLALKWAQQLSPSCEDCRVADIESVSGHVMMLMSQFDKKKKILKSFIQKFDENGKPSGQPVLLIELNSEKGDESNGPDLIISHDEHLMACAYRSVAKDKEEQVYSIVAFDTMLTIVYKKDFSIHIKAKQFGPISSVLTDNGNFFLLGIEFTTDKKVKNPGESFYKLFSYNIKTGTVESNDIKLESQFLTDVGISADNLNKKIVIAGFYSDKTTYSTAGVFYYSLTEDSLKSTPVVTSSFSLDFLRKFAMERKENGKELTNYTINRIVLRKDGGAAIIAESYNTFSQSYWDYYLQMWVYHYYYHYGNIMSLSINPDGKMLWSNVITKDQNSTDDNGYYSSFLSAIINGKFFAIYNKFLTMPSSVLLTSITGTGNQNTKSLFNESENIAVIPKSAKQVDEETILMPALRDEKPCLVKISF
jgi:hypothetical protein